MANCLFGWPNHVDATTPTVVGFSGGSWSGTLPLTNLRDPLLYKVARSSSASLANAQFDIDLGVTARYIRLFAIPRHNLKQTAKIRIRGTTVSSNFGKAMKLTATAAGGKFALPVTFASGGTKFFSIHAKTPSTTPVTSIRIRILDSGATVRLNAVINFDTAGVATSTPTTGTLVGVDVEDGYQRIKINTASGLVAGVGSVEVWPNGTTDTALHIIATNVYVTESAADTPYTETGSNLTSQPWNFASWTPTTASIVTNGYKEPNGPQVYDTDWLDVWPLMWDVGILPWGSPNLWTRRLTSEQIATYRAGFVHVAPTGYAAQYWRYEFDDTTNADGYVQLHRLVMSPGYVPSVNMQFGAQFGLLDTTTYEESLGGTRYYDERPQRKVMSMLFDDLPEDELLGVMQEMQRDLGVVRQLFFVHAADDSFNLARRAMLATFKELSPIEYAYYGRGKLPMILEEVL